MRTKETKEKPFDDGAVRAHPPSAPMRLRITKNHGPRRTWLFEWRPPEDMGGESVFEYRVELRHENPDDPSSMTDPKPIYSGRALACEVDCRALRLLAHTPIELVVRGRNSAGLGKAASVEDTTDEPPAREVVARPPPEE